MSSLQMTRLKLALLLPPTAALLFAVAAGACIRAVAQSGCESTAETMKAVRQKLAGAPEPEDLDDALQQLKYVNSECPNDGDAWYFRAQVEQRLKRPASDVEFSLSRAKAYRSPALRNGLDPFAATAVPTASLPSAGAPPTTKDLTPPQITISEPAVTRGQSLQLKTCRITVKGRATDASEIRDVAVNGAPTEFDKSGAFSATPNLISGSNRIFVTATDAHGNTAREEFTLACGSAPPVVAAAPPRESAGRYFALLIGVQDYKHSSITPLTYPIGDAKNVWTMLTTKYTFDPQNVTLLENPDRRTVIKKLNEMEKTLKPEDHLLIFYAGHGHWVESRDQGYWLPSDAEEGEYSSWISNSDLREAIRGIKTRHTLLISDACFSGGIFVSREAFKRSAAIEELSKLPSRTAMTSGAMTTVPDRSVFVKYLLEYLGDNQEPYLLASDLFNRLRTPVINNSPRQESGDLPTPRYGTIQEAGDKGGDFVFIRRR